MEFLATSKVTDRSFKNITDLHKVMDEMDNLVFRGSFNQRVREYKEIVYGYITDYTRQSPDVRYYTLNVPQRIDYWVTTIQAVLWNYSEAPFSFYFRDSTPLKLTDNATLDNTLNEFYKDSASTMSDFFSNIRFNFKQAFSNFLRDWFELGMGVMRLHASSTGNMHLRAVEPETVSITYNDDGQINNVLIYNSKSYVYELFSLISDKEFVDEKKWQHTVYMGNKDNDKVNKESSKIIDFQPIFISMSNVLSGKYIGWGKGLEALPTIKASNNLHKSIVESVSADLQPLMMIGSNSIDLDTSNNPYSKRVSSETSTRTIISDNISSASPPSQLPIVRNYQVAFNQLEMYKADIEDLLTPNKLIVAKGVARMTAEEARMRDNYDKNEITFMTASVIDDTLIPLIREVFNYVIIKKGGGKSVLIETIRDIAGVEDLVLEDFAVDLKNLRGDKQISERSAEIIDYLKIIGMVLQLGDNDIIDKTSLLAEVSALYQMAGSSTEGYISSINQLASHISTQTGENLQEQNSTS